MWPSLYSGSASRPFSVEDSPIHRVAGKLAKGLLGEDMDFDFDMLISKVSGTSYVFLSCQSLEDITQ